MLNKDVGNYFAPVGTPAEILGINPANRIGKIFSPIESTPALKSTAKDIIDSWTDPQNAYPAKGGGTQIFVPKKNNMLEVH